MSESSTHSLVGTELDKRYRIVEPLGQGGMGAVFRGEHVRIGRQVAIKVLNADLADSEDFLERFEREAIAAGRLDHPNCVPVTDSGHLDDGTAYMVMELVEGLSLRRLMDREDEPLAPARALHILRYVLRGLRHAHKMGIVHRDIKPDNIMLCEREGEEEFARVLDFGIAKLRDDDSKGKEALTQAGMAVGTPAYLSPEQALGDTIDPRSDLYSCAVVLFEMLCGRPPFEAETPIGVLTKHASQEPPELAELTPTLAHLPVLGSVVRRGLEKERDARFQSASEFISAVDECLAELGVPTARARTQGSMPSSPYQRPETYSSFEPRNATAPHAVAMAPTALSAGIPQTLDPPPRSLPLFVRRIVFLACAAGLIALAVVLSKTGGGDGEGTIGSGGPLLARETHEQELRQGKTCKDRLAAVKALEALGDPGAIPALKKARRRMRGGVLGVAKKNTNRCLVKAANQAIETLEK